MDAQRELTTADQLPEHDTTRLFLDGVPVTVEANGDGAWRFIELSMELVRLDGDDRYCFASDRAERSFADALTQLQTMTPSE